MTFASTIPTEEMLTWESQAPQYPETGPPGITYFRGDIDVGQAQHDLYVDCLLCRDEDGQLIGVLNYYSIDLPPYEKAGNFNVWIHPERRRQGVATRLLVEARRRWPIRLDKQRYSPAGAAWANALRTDGIA